MLSPDKKLISYLGCKLGIAHNSYLALKTISTIDFSVEEILPVLNVDYDESTKN